jgi:hypothetical protein
MENVLLVVLPIVCFFLGAAFGERTLKKEINKISNIVDKANINEMSGKMAIGLITDIVDKLD